MRRSLNRRLTTLMAAAVVATTTVAVSPASAGAQDGDDKAHAAAVYYTGRAIVRHSGKVIAIKSASTANLASAIQYEYSYRNAMNDVMVLETEPNSLMRIKPKHTFSDDGNPHNDKCLAVKGASVESGAVIVNATCTYDDVNNDVWYPSGLGNGYEKWVNYRSQLCLVVKGASESNGALLIQYACNGSSNGQWNFNEAY